MAQALGIRLLDAEGRDLSPGGSSLLSLAHIDMSGLNPAVRRVAFTVATDVDNPLTGPSGASAVYGPQKGASPEDVALLDRALGHLAAVIYRDLGVDVRTMPGAGAAGGLGAGMVAFLGAHLRRGVDVVMDAVGLPGRVAEADVVVTGEGSFDQQSLRGKVAAGIRRVAAEHRVPLVLLCGQALIEPPPGVRVEALADRFGIEAAMARPGELLRRLAAEVAEALERERGPVQDAESN